jgi:hypothetical protein
MRDVGRITAPRERPPRRAALRASPEPIARYIVRELPWLKGSRRRTLERLKYFSAACSLAERVSREGRQILVECDHLQLAVWVNGKRL